MAAIAMTFFTACSDSSDSSIDTKGQSIYLKLGNAQTRANTRSDEVQLDNTDAVELTDGYIYFVTAQDGIKAIYKIEKSTTTNIDQKTIKLSDLQAGYKFTNISGEVASVYIVGNPNLTTNEEDVTMRSFTTLTALKAGVNISLSTQNNVSDLTIEGSGTVTAANATDLDVDASAIATGDRQAIITLKPLCARIEIAKLTASGTISGYTLQGIYINPFHIQTALNGVLIAADQKSEEALSNFDSSVATSLYHTYPSMCDDNALSIGTKSDLITTPITIGGAWAYQYFAATTPRVIVKISGVTSTGTGTFPGTQFLNVRGFRDSSNNVITTLQRGNVYKITDLVFTESHLSQVPDPEDINLWVKVSVTPWVINTVTPDM